ncbi:MAG TPA: hypothetical protein VM819_19220 [Vicinamibacterales bacterium]|nr:hypothetical protein [Vicinamibacterales bacterium]
MTTLEPHLMHASSVERSEGFLFLRRPLFLAFMLGCGVSVLGSGRFTLRLIADGTLSFAFVPLCQLSAFAVVHRLQHSRLPFRQAVDRYFAGNTPWLWWMAALMVAAAILPAIRAGSVLPMMLVSIPIPIALSMRFDWRLFRGDGRTRAQAAMDILLQRAIAWSLATAYFLGLAITSRDFFYLFVEAGQAISTWVREIL